MSIHPARPVAASVSSCAKATRRGDDRESLPRVGSDVAQIFRSLALFGCGKVIGCAKLLREREGEGAREIEWGQGFGSPCSLILPTTYLPLVSVATVTRVKERDSQASVLPRLSLLDRAACPVLVPLPCSGSGRRYALDLLKQSRRSLSRLQTSQERQSRVTGACAGKKDSRFVWLVAPFYRYRLGWRQRRSTGAQDERIERTESPVFFIHPPAIYLCLLWLT